MKLTFGAASYALTTYTSSAMRDSFTYLYNSTSSSFWRSFRSATPYTRRVVSVYCPLQRSPAKPLRFLLSPTVSHCHLQRHCVAYLPNAQPISLARHYATGGRSSTPNTSNTVRYIVATTIVVLGLSYAAVPLYRLFCQASGYGGTVTKVEAGEKIERMEPDRERSIVVR